MRNYLEELPEEERIRSRKSSTAKEGISEEFTFGHRCSNRAIDFLSRYNTSDFFLTVSYDEPHGPFLCPEPYASMYKDDTFPKSPNVYDTLENKPEHQKVWAGDRLGINKNDLQIRRSIFFGCNSFVDAEIGRVLEAVEQYAPEALVIYTADHGDMMHSHCLNGKGPVMYDEITNIPFIVKWPGQVPEGTASDVPVSHIDVVPTVLDVFGLETPKIIEGKSMRNTLRTPDRPTHDIIFMEFNRFEVDHDGFGGFQPIRACFDGRLKLSVNLMVSDELYDLENDPQEMNNLIDAPAYVKDRNRLHDALLAWMNETRDPFRGYYWENRPWRKDARTPTWEYTGMTRQREEDERYEARQLNYDTGLPMKEAVRKK
jgi:uncharacterized sulfatase